LLLLLLLLLLHDTSIPLVTLMDKHFAGVGVVHSHQWGNHNVNRPQSCTHLHLFL